MSQSNKPRILVLGDAFVDRYHIGTSTRQSAEAPIPIVKITKTLNFDGGAANVGNNLHTLGAEVLINTGRPWPIKNRLMVGDTQLARWDENDETTPQLFPESGLDTVEAVVISDYAKGSITPEVIEAVAKLDLPTFIDTKQDPRIFDDIQHRTYFPNDAEWNAFSLGYSTQFLKPHIGLVAKHGAKGLSVRDITCRTLWRTVPTLAKHVVSVNGAGDTVVAAYTYAVIAKHSNPLLFSAAAAAVVCEKPYTATATLAEIQEVLDRGN